MFTMDFLNVLVDIKILSSAPFHSFTIPLQVSFEGEGEGEGDLLYIFKIPANPHNNVSCILSGGIL